MKSNKFNISHLFSAIALTVSLFALSFLTFGFSNHKSGQQPQKGDSIKYHLPYIPNEVTFCGEQVPLHLLDVRESLQKELITNNYFHSQTIQIILRSGRYFPAIEKVLKENNIPDDFKYLAAAESALLNASSPAGAIGYWQILEETGKEYGLEINNEVDERYHIEKSTEAAAKFLKKAYDKHGNWAMAAASYNRGMNGIERQVERQKQNSYYNLLLNTETARYVYRIIALKLILEMPQKYGFNVTKADYYTPYQVKTVVIKNKVGDFADFAGEHHTNYKVLKLLNPWLRETYLTNSGSKEYSILVPKKHSGLIRN